MAPCSGRPGLPIFICGQSAPLDDGEPPTECERAGSRVRPAKQGGSRCHRRGRRRIRRQAGRARRRSRSRRRRPRAGSSGGWESTQHRVQLGSRFDLAAADRRARSQHLFLRPSWLAAREVSGRRSGHIDEPLAIRPMSSSSSRGSFQTASRSDRIPRRPSRARCRGRRLAHADDRGHRRRPAAGFCESNAIRLAERRRLAGMSSLMARIRKWLRIGKKA